jgi:hypothetical protein
VLDVIQTLFRYVVRQNVVGSFGLIEDRTAILHNNGAAIAESARTIEAAEVVIERTVFLHEDDDVLDILDSSSGGARVWKR